MSQLFNLNIIRYFGLNITPNSFISRIDFIDYEESLDKFVMDDKYKSNFNNKQSNKDFEKTNKKVVQNTKVISYDLVDLINRPIKTFENYAVNLNGENYENVINELQRVKGIGENKAKEFYEDGIRSIEDLIKSPKISDRIKICAKYVDELEKKIKHDDITRIFKILELSIGKNKNINSIDCVGSYRRRKKESGDIDILICLDTEDFNNTKNIIDPIIDTISKLDINLYTLNKGSTSMEIIAKMENVYALIDIYFTTKEEYGAALLHTTGSAEFNIIMSLHAIKKGYKLSIHGLFKKDTGDRIKTYTEEDVFKELDMEYIPPEIRDNRRERKKYFD